MGHSREEFKAVLDAIIAANGSGKVYGQEPPNTGMIYPAIIYKEDLEDVKRADNIPYDITDRYSVTIIEENPTRPVAKAVRLLQYCSFNRRFEVDDLIHTVYNIYF